MLELARQDPGRPSMPASLFAMFPVTQKCSEQDTSQNTASMPPVVDSGDKNSECENTDNPAAHLPVNSLSVNPPSAFAKIKRGAYQAAHRGRGSDSEFDTRQIADGEPGNPP